MCFGTWTAYKKAGTGTRRLLRAIKSARWNGHEPRGAAVIQAGEQLLRRPLLKLGQRGQAASTGGVLVAGCARHKLDVAVCGGGVRAWRRACLAACVPGCWRSRRAAASAVASAGQGMVLSVAVVARGGPHDLRPRVICAGQRA